MSLQDIVSNAHVVKETIRDVCASSGRDPTTVELVAVSKTKPAENIKALYDAGYRHFGENYFQELSEKAPALPSDIHWHFIGHLQSSKSSKLIRDVPNLYCIQTVDSIKLATKLNNAMVAASDIRQDRLNVMVQVMTSDEDSKSGVQGEELSALVRFILNECPKLQFTGLMTIGAPGDQSCFNQLAACRLALCEREGLDITQVQLSMGMSSDYEVAVAQGANVVRVGSTIFGERIYKKK